MPEATPRPWKRDPGSPYAEFGSDNAILLDGPEEGGAIVSVCIDDGTHGTPAPSRQEAEANAELIIRAVNAHDALREACEAAVDTCKACAAKKYDAKCLDHTCPKFSYITLARAALALADG